MPESEGFAALFSQFEQERTPPARREPRPGDRVRGRVLSIQGDNLFIDLGTKTEGVADVAEFTDADGHLTVAVGDAIELAVSGKDEDSGTLLLGTRHARRAHGSKGLRQAFEEQRPVEGLVTATTKGGLEVELSGVRAFCPASQIDGHFVEDLETFVGQRLPFRITKFEGGRHPDLVVSRRVLLKEEQRARAAETRARLEVGAVLEGRVSALKDFGAFIDLGGIDGLVHVSELAFGRVAHPSEVLTVGQQVKVAVLRIEPSGDPRRPERVALSIRALEKDPWQEVLVNFPVGAQVEGRVNRLQPFGAFVELAPGVDGLIHVSELGAGRRITHPQEVLELGQQVQATVISVDPEKKRIGLSLDPDKQARAHADTAEYGRPETGFGTLGDLLRESLRKQGQKT